MSNKCPNKSASRLKRLVNLVAWALPTLQYRIKSTQQIKLDALVGWVSGSVTQQN